MKDYIPTVIAYVGEIVCDLLLNQYLWKQMNKTKSILIVLFILLLNGDIKYAQI